MSFPILINELEIIFRLLERSSVSIDPDFLEPVGDDIFSSQTVSMVGQANFRGSPILKRLSSLSGDSEPTDGHLVVRFEDMVDAGLATNSTNPGFVLAKGDRIIQVASQEVNFEVIEIRPESPLDSVDSDALLVYIDFKNSPEDRSGVGQ